MLSMNKYGPAEVFRQRFELALSPLPLRQNTADDLLNLIADYLHGFALAGDCQSESDKLTVNDIEGPLRLVMRVLENEITS